MEKPRLIEHHPSDTQARVGNRFRILSWNVHKESSEAFQADLCRLVDSGRSDFVLLQEATDSRESNRVQASLKNRSWLFSANLQDSALARVFGVATASLVRPIQRLAILSTGKEPLLGTRKPALLTRYPTETDTLSICNVHALNFSPDLDGFRQQFLEIHRILGTDPGHAIVAGDFNTWSRKKQGIVDSILSLSGMIAVDFGGQGKKRTTAFGNPLDHVYYNPGFLRVHSGSTRVHDSIRSSDHVPLEVEFEVLPNSVKLYGSADPNQRESIPTDRNR